MSLTAGTGSTEKVSTILTGVDRLKERPISDLVEALRENGCVINYLEKQGYFPIEVVRALSADACAVVRVRWCGCVCRLATNNPGAGVNSLAGRW
jgi:5-enolpyruvylshikimate-3-phosphate synthase